VVEKVAGPPLIRYPLFAAFDDQGRLFVAEGTGTNLPGEKLVKLKRGRILLLEDTDGDGKFDTSKVFADKLVFPTGVLWHDGALYATSHPNLWRFQDTTGKGKADRREALVSRFNFNGNGCDIHGPFAGPDGRLYWTDGRHGYKVKTCEGKILEGFASRIWRCRIDGSDIERLCGGGFDNPVELAFTAEGELIGTMDQGPGDALLHYVEGGVYPMQHPCVKEFAMTGPMLGSIKQYTAALPVALCGLCRYRSSQFGKDYQGCLFTAQFNVHRIERHTLVRDGATFRSVEKDFVTSTDPDVHITDVWEDADGSLLFIDMGAWFNYGCPTSKIAKPEVLGGIYRVRRAGAHRVADPWGKSLKLATRSIADLTPLLDDPRPKFRDQVIIQLAKRGAGAVPSLAAVLRPEGKRSVQARRNAVWALCRIRTPEAQAGVRSALGDKHASVRQAALHAAGVERDTRAVPALLSLVVKDEPPLRLKAAEALGRIGKAAAIPALLQCLGQRQADRFLEHACIYALIRLNNPRATLTALDNPNPRVRLAGLIALDQMKDGKLTRELVVPLLDTDHPDLQQTALEIMSRHPGWSGDILGFLRKWLTSPRLSAGKQRSLTGALLAFSSDKKVQQLVVETLAEPKTPVSMRLLLLRVLARCRLDPLPKRWHPLLGQALAHKDQSVRREAIATLKARNLAHCDKELGGLSRQKDLPADLRIAALDCLAGRIKQTDAESFKLLMAHVSAQADPLLQVAAARTLGASPLTRHQLMQLARSVAEAGPIVLPLLVPALGKTHDGGVGRAFVQALGRSPGAEALGVAELDRLLKGYSPEIKKLAEPVREKLAARQKKQAAYLVQLSAELQKIKGNAEHGWEVFLSRKVGCYTCHRVAGKGSAIGPDLSQVGRFRSPRDLLESIVFPSSSIVPEFRSYRIMTKAGKLASGIIMRESTAAIYLRTPELAEIRIARKDVDEITPSDISLMPEGLEKTMTRQELADLLEFLGKQK
jgi:putative heme-binding domain-containing protein